VYEYTGKTVNNGYTEYTWDIEVTRQDSDSKGEGKTLNLSAIKARVYTDEDGNQTVTFIIPEDLMPTYYPDLHKQFYYEELPVRLIYKVGPTTTAAATAKSGQQFYTNTFGTMDEEDEEYDLSMMADTIVQIMPAENNPYYFGDSAQTSSAVAKTENSTDTAADSFVEYVSGNVVTQLLGNNGMLTMGDVVKLSIIKAWDGVEAANRAPVTVWLFRQKQYDDGTEGSVDYYGSYTLNEDNHWTQSLKALDRSGTDDDGKGFIWQYYVTESVTDIYKYGVTYIGEDGSVLSYITLKTTQGGVDYDALRLYPVNGVTTITNRSSSLTINKNWEKDEPGADSVTVNLYRTRTPMQGSAAPRSELIETITLSSSNNWSYTRQNAPSVAFDTDYMTACYYDYYVEEVPVTGYNAAYSVGDGIDVPPTRLTVNGESITAYPASGNVTITNTKVIPKITVTKEWSDGYDSHSTNGISVGLFQRILVDETDADALEYQYLLVDRQWLTPDNSWSYTWTLPDEIGKTLTFDSLAYTVVDYCVAELSSTDGYTPVFYSVDDDGNRTEMASFATKTEYYQFNGAKVIQDVEHVDESVTLYRADSRIVIRNTANDILTVRKEWEDGIYQQDEVQVELIPMSDFGEGQLVAVASTTFTQETGIDCHIVLSADNDWTYTWTDLPLSLSNDDETVPITYYVRENETLYTPTYTDGSGIPAQTGTTDSKEVIPAALRPGDGVIVITNHVRNTELTLTKTWQGVPSDEWEAVTVNVYRNQYSMTISETLMKPELENEGELYATVELSADNEWTSSVNLPLVKIDADGTAHTYEYYIRELEGSVQYNVSYTLERDIGDLKLEQVEMIAESGNYMADLSFLMGYGPSNHVIITNAATYTLPHAGGIGTYWYKWSGTALLMIAAALYIFFRYRQKNRGKC
jgi:LPXTG-motif cell wall-anchored protein